MNKHLQNINARLSLRKPQRECLEILADLIDNIELEKDSDASQVLAKIRNLKDAYKTVEDFERDFASVCFSVATGVGKTRLMGACIAYLYLTGKSKHFMVLAPNLTIYQKLISDFTPNSPKYVFKGLSEFVTDPPVIVTAENYESGKGVRSELLMDGTFQLSMFQDLRSAHINIFNISKINSEVRSSRTAKIKQLSEYIGSSYFDYLSNLKDLVLLMDEAHRYRATQGARAINELNPILGLEFTATPQTIVGKEAILFKNVIYNYPLAAALNDGFIKEPAVLTRENFVSSDYTDEKLELYKLKDGIHNHEYVKVQLFNYASNNKKPVIKPFVLVVARNIEHASSLKNLIESKEFFDGRYKGKVLEIHSGHEKVEEDANIERLLAIENNQEPTEIVIHVDKLKEGWDVTNLYTVIPLRKADSKTLVEQCIGRGLRLPYGMRVGDKNVDRLTIIAHDKFQEIVDLASDPEWAIKFSTVILGKDIPTENLEVMPATSAAEAHLGLETQGNDDSLPVESKVEAKSVFETPEEKTTARACFEAIQRQNLPTSSNLKKPEVKKALIEEVKRQVAGQLKIEELQKSIDDIMDNVIDAFIEWNIDIPEIIVLPDGETTYWFRDFDLDTSTINFQPEAEDLLVHNMRTNERERIGKAAGVATEARLEDYLVTLLIDRQEISYDNHSDLLYKVAGQVVSKLKSYLKTDDEILNVLQSRQKVLAELIFVQMMKHYEQTPCKYSAKITQGFISLRGSIVSGTAQANFRTEVKEKLQIQNTVFTGFKKCCSARQKFDSDSERRFAVILEDSEKFVDHWIKPAPGIFRIKYESGSWYEPDFVVETATAKFICEVKARDDMQNDDVKAKSRAAVEWCDYANQHATEYGGKPFSYLLIPHDEIKHNVSFNRLVDTFTVSGRERTTT
jgi:type III restriction enzyme